MKRKFYQPIEKSQPIEIIHLTDAYLYLSKYYRSDSVEDLNKGIALLQIYGSEKELRIIENLYLSGNRTTKTSKPLLLDLLRNIRDRIRKELGLNQIYNNPLFLEKKDNIIHSAIIYTTNHV